MTNSQPKDSAELASEPSVLNPAMRLFGFSLILVGVTGLLWSTACFLFRRSYFRPLAKPERADEAYRLAVEAGERLASDLYLPCVVVCFCLCVAGAVCCRNSKTA
jgi:hypothetical protein